jgi:acetyl-CoA carboxylase alpha subunit
MQNFRAARLERRFDRLEIAAASLKMTAPDLLRLGLIDGIVPEPPQGAHADPDAAAESLRLTLREALASLANMTPKELIDDRYKKFRAMGSAFVTET